MERASITDIQNALNCIPPSSLDYNEWLSVGMALKSEGVPCSAWDNWSRADSRYKAGVCENKWESFSGGSGGEPVTIKTVFKMAMDYGYKPHGASTDVFDWDSEINYEETQLTTGEAMPIFEPKEFYPAEEIKRYITALFEPSDIIGYVTQSWETERDGKAKHLPTKGVYSRTAADILKDLDKYGDDIGASLGDYNPQAGAWIRINPLDGAGVKNENVTDFRYALVESDSMPLAQQNAVLHELELPIATLVYSGGKSLHALVKVNAKDYDEYRKRVDYLYKICKQNGLDIDKQNRNPSRLSRLPGIVRGDKKQYLIETNIGKQSFEQWQEYIESISDDLPDSEVLADEWEHLPELAPPLIDGVLRQGHKMLIAGPSKAGKSFALIEMCIAIAEGTSWLGFNCAQGKVMYVNLELDRASCLHRFKDVYNALGLEPEHLDNIVIWNLRGKSKTMKQLASPLIRRIKKANCIAVIIDPIYKVITGDENNAAQMADFCNHFDKVCTEAGCAVIYCHHHSKGLQGGKRSMDRASGSGVFARDPDALLDLSELTTTEDIRTPGAERASMAIVEERLALFKKNGSLTQQDRLSLDNMLSYAREHLTANAYARTEEQARQVYHDKMKRTAWRIEGTLREFASFEPLDVWFDYPIHTADDLGELAECEVESEWQKNFGKRRTNEERAEERSDKLAMAFEACKDDKTGTAKIAQIAAYMKLTRQTIKNYIDADDNFERDEQGFVSRR